jgi:hypothetical protein
MRHLLQLQEHRQRVREWSMAGATQEEVAQWLGMPLKRVHRLFRAELREGEAHGKQTILKKLYEAASSGENLNAMLFWVKAKCGWRDTGVRESVAALAWPPFVLKLNTK